ncbi:MAG: DUF58 domain-containing protein [Crenarchaeota archaeon]|nr:DUF58 domain-containing protein [Thermoproteota archaeon]
MSTSELSRELERYLEKVRSLITRDLSKYCLTLFTILVVLGILLANVYILYSSTGILATLLTFLAIPRPDVEIQLQLERREYKIGDVMNLKVRVISSRGLGTITIRLSVPENLEVIHGRTSFMIIKGIGRSEQVYDIMLRASKTGRCRVTVSEVELYHIFGIGGPKKLNDVASIEIMIAPYVVKVSRSIRLRPMKMRIPPIMVSRLMLGAASTEFREIRKYVPGDPVKNINWKATARTGSDVPLVNEYEKESISRVMIIPDLSERTDIGGRGVHVQEEIISITFSLIRSLLKRGCRVYVLDPYDGKIRNVRGLREYVRTYRDIIERKSDGRTGIDVLHIVGKGMLKIRNIDYMIILTYIDQNTVRVLENLRTLAKRCKIVIIDFDISNILKREEYGEYVAEMYRIYKVMFQRYLRKFNIRTLIHTSGLSIGRIVNMLLCQVS